MARIIKRKKRRLSPIGKFCIFFIIVLMLGMCQRIFLSTYEIKMQMEIQKMQKQIVDYKEANKKLEMEINTLASKEHIYEIASMSGMEQITENIISVVETEKE